MKRFYGYILSLSILLTIGGFGIAVHTSTMSASMHAGHKTTHSKRTQTNASTRCVTLCTSAVVNKEDEYQSSEKNKEDDEPHVPFYVQPVSIFNAESLNLSRALLTAVKPPPKVPIYILYGVFRV